MRHGLLVFGLVLLAGCRTGVGTNVRLAPIGSLPSPSQAYASARIGTMLLPGTINGYVARWDGRSWVAAPDVAVKLVGAEATTTTDALGCYGFTGVPAGVHQLRVEAAGTHAHEVACRLGEAAGVSRVNLALVPRERPTGVAADQLTVAGVAVDPRGTALPGATVRVADSLTSEGNRAVQADVDGFWSIPLRGVTSVPLGGGQATMTVFGTTPGGVRVESTDALGFALDAAPTYALTAATKAFAAPKGLRWTEAAGTRRVLAGENLPTRRDELVVRWARPQGWAEGVPQAIQDGKVVLDVPPGYGSDAAVELLPLGLLPPDGKAPSLSLGAPLAP